MFLLRIAFVMCLLLVPALASDREAVSLREPMDVPDAVKADQRRVADAFKDCPISTSHGQPLYIIELPSLTLQIPVPITEERAYELLDLRIDGKYLIPRAKSQGPPPFACSE